MYDIIIVGGGPAGLTAALYAGRFGLSVSVFEKTFAGGQAGFASEIANYPGFPDGISGMDLSLKLEAHAKQFGAQFLNQEITDFDLSGDPKQVTTAKGTYACKSLILATGSTARKLGVSGEDRLLGRGVSYCATCDGAFFKEKDVAVIGGGDTALSDAVFLSQYCNTVYLIHRRDTFRGTNVVQEKAKSIQNINIIYHHVLSTIKSDETVTGIEIEDVINHDKTSLDVSGIFIAIGTTPNTDHLKDVLPLTQEGYIQTDQFMQVGIPGVYAAGDVREKPLRQVITAAADGAIAAYQASIYIQQNF